MSNSRTDSHKLASYDGVMAFQQVAPSAVAELCRAVARADDVREEHRRQHSVGLSFVPSARIPEVGEEALELHRNRSVRPPDGEVARAWYLDELGSW
jgi:hypothetical protein